MDRPDGFGPSNGGSIPSGSNPFLFIKKKSVRLSQKKNRFQILPQKKKVALLNEFFLSLEIASKEALEFRILPIKRSNPFCIQNPAA